MVELSLTRRQLLAATGVTVASAGCLGNNGSDDRSGSRSNESDDGSGSRSNGSDDRNGSRPNWVDWIPADTADEQATGPIGLNVEEGLSQTSDNSILRGVNLTEVLDFYDIDKTDTSYVAISDSFSTVIVGEFQSAELITPLLEGEAEEIDPYDGYRILRYPGQHVAIKDGVIIVSTDPEQIIDAKAGRITQYGQTGDAAQVLEKMDNAVLQGINTNNDGNSDIPAENQLRKVGITINHTNIENRISSRVYYLFSSSSAAETAAAASDDILINDLSTEADRFDAEVINSSQEGDFFISQISADDQLIETIL